MVDPSLQNATPDARARIRTADIRAGRRFAVLDDDPTGSQSVHDVSLVMVLDRLSPETIPGVELETGVPLVYRLNADSTVASKEILKAG